ncbi:MAG: hypothetical protein HFI49_01105 [Bacilli bacterium]|jgi:hypothetical protein|nr:hypothetical protein [Bacilli bacterium]
MKDLMKTNCYDVEDIMILVGSCLERMQPKAYNDLKNISNNIYDVCLESYHINMVITKIIGIICRARLKKIIFASVDKSLHCVQLHYIENEIRKAMSLDNIEIVHYVAIDDELIKIDNDVIKKSKSLSELQKENKGSDING